MGRIRGHRGHSSSSAALRATLLKALFGIWAGALVLVGYISGLPGAPDDNPAGGAIARALVVVGGLGAVTAGRVWRWVAAATAAMAVAGAVLSLWLIAAFPDLRRIDVISLAVSAALGFFAPVATWFWTSQPEGRRR